jgi:dihydropteroate synthase/2-amino-4-hydroxy-6-hydroxymethyldihydropteridine diphosphokinase
MTLTIPTPIYTDMNISAYTALAPVYFSTRDPLSKKLKKISLDIDIRKVDLSMTVGNDSLDTENQGLDYSVLGKRIGALITSFSNTSDGCSIFFLLGSLYTEMTKKWIPSELMTHSTSLTISCTVEKPFLALDRVELKLSTSTMLDGPSTLVSAKSIPVWVIIGINDWERENRQKILIDIDLVLENVPLTENIDLSEYIQDIQSYSQRNHLYKTLEAFSFHLGQYATKRLSTISKGKNLVSIQRFSACKPAAIALAKQVSISWSGTDLSISNRYSSVYLALGSNLGNRLENITKAIHMMEEMPLDSMVVKSISRLYLSKPMYYHDQDYFLNACCRIETTLSAQELLLHTQRIQDQVSGGVTKSIVKGPRIIDIDILYYDNIVVDDYPRLVIPHPGILERPFVLQPLIDLGLVECPSTGRSINDALSKLSALDSPIVPFRNGTRLFAYEKSTVIMGILNMTPDSFSGDGLEGQISKALDKIHHWLNLYMPPKDHETSRECCCSECCFLLDIGGASSRPGAEDIPEYEEWSRIEPVLKAIKSDPTCIQFRSRMLISIDTSSSNVATMAVDTGIVDVLNDSSGTGALIPVSAKHNIPIVLMHRKGTCKNMMTMVGTYPHANNTDSAKASTNDLFIGDIQEELGILLEKALEAGIPPWNIVLDPGIGFAKSTNQDLALLRDFGKLDICQRYPFLIGASRKKFILHCNAEQKDPSTSHPRSMATAATCTAAISQGAAFVRIHDLDMLKPSCRLSDCIYKI